MTCDAPPWAWARFASLPITAIESTRRGLSGSAPLTFFSSVMPFSATSRAASPCSSTDSSDGSGSSSKSPTANIVRRIRCTCSSIVAMVACPESTAAPIVSGV